VFAGPLHIAIPEWPPSEWADMWYGPEHFGVERAQIEAGLEQVYNAADIDGSKVVWAREMDAADNLELMHYYPDRKVWLVEPDSLPATFLLIRRCLQLPAGAHRTEFDSRLAA
jgi:hypothetical protein